MRSVDSVLWVFFGVFGRQEEKYLVQLPPKILFWPNPGWCNWWNEGRWNWRCIACVRAGYAETSVDKLTSALYEGLVSYNQLPNLVFFKEAVHHAARLSRVLVSSSHVWIFCCTFHYHYWCYASGRPFTVLTVALLIYWCNCRSFSLHIQHNTSGCSLHTSYIEHCSVIGHVVCMVS